MRYMTKTMSAALITMVGLLILPGTVRGADRTLELKPTLGPLTQVMSDEVALVSIIEVTPTEHDFGEVQVGAASSVIIEIQNINGHNLLILDVSLDPASDPGFFISDSPNFPVTLSWDDENDSVQVEVTFAPEQAGPAFATLVVTSDDNVNDVIDIPLSGTGVDDEPAPSEMIADIIDMFDEAVEDGSLYGVGHGNSAVHRLNALRHMLLAAGDLIDAGAYEQACRQLASAWAKTDGLPRPPDFVGGEAASELAAMIADLMAAIGCT